MATAFRGKTVGGYECRVQASGRVTTQGRIDVSYDYEWAQRFVVG